MSVAFDFDGAVVVVTGAAGALGSAVAASFHDAGATVVGTDLIDVDDDDSLLDPAHIEAFYTADFTDETDVETVFEDVISAYEQVDVLANIAGTWQGGNSIEETEASTFEMLFDVNLKTMFLASKHAIPHLQETAGSIVSVSARSSLEGGSGDGPYRASKAGIRLLTETIAEEQLGTVRANAVMPSVIDTPMNRQMMPDSDHDTWVDPSEIAAVIVWLASDASSVTSGAAIPVYGEA